MPRLTLERRFSLASATVAADAGKSMAGPNGGSAASSDSTVGNMGAWANPTRVLTNGADYAGTLNVTASTGVTEYLKVTGFGFALGAVTVSGIRVRAIGLFTGNIGDLRDSSIRLTKAGTIVGYDFGVDESTQLKNGEATWGGGLQMWGTTWSPADVNDAGFGCVLSFKNEGGSVARSVTINYVEMSVFYV